MEMIFGSNTSLCRQGFTVSVRCAGENTRLHMAKGVLQRPIWGRGLEHRSRSKTCELTFPVLGRFQVHIDPRQFVRKWQCFHILLPTCLRHVGREQNGTAPAWHCHGQLCPQESSRPWAAQAESMLKAPTFLRPIPHG